MLRNIVEGLDRRLSELTQSFKYTSELVAVEVVVAIFIQLLKDFLERRDRKKKMKVEVGVWLGRHINRVVLQE